MASMKHILDEIHRRSLWQVAVIYILGSVVVLWAVRLLTGTVGLPEWTPVMALLLLLIGFPFAIAAAFVQDSGDGTGNAVTGLISELHQRSLWQVMGIFLAGSWGALQVVEVLTETAGLPDWTPTMALVLLLIGLPVCLATAFVQEGLPGQEGGAGEAAPAVTTATSDATATPPRGAAGLLTWRNAILGGVGAFALLGLSAGGYLLMWTLGIGPVGNLVAQGVITRGERVVLADFDDTTGEGLGAVVTEALRVDLLESSVLVLLEDADLAPTLAQMEVSTAEPLTAERALEVALRAGIPAVIEGDVSPAGSGYIITATLREAERGRSLASLRVTASGPDDVISSIDKLSQNLRERSGESLRDIRAGKPLEQVTTGSLEALKLYTQAIDLFYNENDVSGTVDLMNRALALDSTFAMGWRLLGTAVQGGIDPTLYVEAMTKAYELRDRLQGRERYMVEAGYWLLVKQEPLRGIAAYEALLAVEPDYMPALNNVALQYRWSVGDLETSEDLYRRAAYGPTTRPMIPFRNLVANLLLLRRSEDAAQVIDDFEARYPENEAVPLYRSGLAFLQGDLQGAVDRARSVAEDPRVRPLYRGTATATLARIAQWRGQLDEARRLFLEAETHHRQEGPSIAWTARSTTAYELGLVGDARWARTHTRDGLEGVFDSLPPLDRRHSLVALGLAVSGDLASAERIMDDWREVVPPERKGLTDELSAEAIALYGGVAGADTAGARSAMERVVREAGCRDVCWLLERGRFYDLLGDHARAVDFYERLRQTGFEFRFLGPQTANTAENLYAMLRLGPLYEELGDTARAVEAYQRIVDQWADADAQGMETVRAFRARIQALGG